MEDRIAGKEEKRCRAGKQESYGMKDRRGRDGREEKQEWKTGRQGERKEKQGWTKEEGMTSKKDGRMSKCLNVKVRESKRVDQKSISHKQQHCTRTKIQW
jgi:hypothetical protein